MILAGSWASYHAAHRNDQYQLIQLGQCVAHGGRMYVDCWENKPPGIAWLNAVALLVSRGDPLGPWILPGVVEGGILVVVWLGLRRVYGERTARKTVLLISLVYALRLYDTPSINPDFYASMFELAAVAVFLPRSSGTIRPDGGMSDGVGIEEGPRSCSLLLCALAGLLWAAATCVKQVGCLGLLVFSTCGLLAFIFRRDLHASWLKGLLAAWGGFFLGVAAVAGVLWQQETVREAWHAIVAFNTDLLGVREFLASINNRLRLRGELVPVALPLWLGASAILSAVWYRRHGGAQLMVVAALVIWWAIAAVLAGMGPSGSMRYWQATFPPMLILAAIGLHYIQQVQDRLAHPERLTAFVVAVTAAILLARPAFHELRAGFASSFVASDTHPTEREELREIAGRVRELTQSDERIYVLDFRPGIYVYADRRAAARYNYPRSSAQWEEIVERIRSGQAALVLQPDHTAPEFRKYCGEECQRDFDEMVGRLCREVDGGHDMRTYSCAPNQ